MYSHTDQANGFLYTFLFACAYVQLCLHVHIHVHVYVCAGACACAWCMCVFLPCLLPTCTCDSTSNLGCIRQHVLPTLEPGHIPSNLRKCLLFAGRNLENNQLKILPNEIFTPLHQDAQIVLTNDPLACCPSSLAARGYYICSSLPSCTDQVTA